MLLAALALGSGCVDNKTKMKEAQKKRDAEKKAQEEKEAARLKALQPKVDRAKLDSFWDDPSFLKVTLGRPCPEGLWSIFPGTPGEEGAEQTANEAKRPELTEKMKNATFVVLLAHGNGVTMRKYNAKKKQLTVEVDGLVECYDKLGLLSVAWGEPAKPFRPPAPDADEEEQNPPQAVWRAQPLLFPLPFPNAAEANKFRDKAGLGIETRLVFKLGKIDIDKKTQKFQKPRAEVGETQELDWGAGRLVHVEVLGVRVGTDFEKTMLAEKRKEP